MKKIAITLATVIFGLLLHSQLSRAQEIYKWVDEKETTHYADNLNAVPEKYQGQVLKRDVDELPPILTYKPKTPQSYSSSSGPSGSTIERSKPLRQDSRSFQGYDPTNDPEYQQMISRLEKSIYYQRDIYRPGTQRVSHHAGELIPGGSAAAQNLKEELDRLVSNPEFGQDTQYRRDVRNFFDGHFYQRDEYFPRTQSIMHSRGEIKVISTEYNLRDTRDIPKGNFQTNPTPVGLIKTNGGAIDTGTGEFYPGSKGGIINPRTGEFMPDVGGGYIDPKTGRFIPKQ